MRVSVIIPTYNRADKLKRCLQSLVSQTFKNFEVIVCDDGSTDETVGIVKEFSTQLNLIYDYDTNFGGPARPRNRGLFLAKGEFIAFLDSDDWWYPKKLEVCLEHIRDYDLVYHKLEKYSEPDKPIGEMKTRALTTEPFKDLVINGNQILNSSVVLRKSLTETIGLISEDKILIAAEDYDYWIRISTITSKFSFIPENLGAYWLGENISASVSTIYTEQYLLAQYVGKLTPTEQLYSKRLLAFRAARIYHSLNMFKEAKKDYYNSLPINNPIVKFKSLIGILSSTLKLKM